MEQPIKSERARVKFFDGLEVDGYRMPNGDFRVDLSSVSSVVGYASNWLSRILADQNCKPMKALCAIGFSQNIQKTVSPAQKRGNVAKTISLRDFNRVIAYATSRGKKAAIALQLALTEVALNDFFRDAFGEPPLSIDQKRELFYKAYASTISPQHWREMDREDILRLALPNDEPHLAEGLWNDWDPRDEKIVRLRVTHSSIDF